MGHREASCSFIRRLGWVGHGEWDGVAACWQLYVRPGESEHPPPTWRLRREPSGEAQRLEKGAMCGQAAIPLPLRISVCWGTKGFCAVGLFIRQLPLAVIDVCPHRNAPSPRWGRQIFMQSPF